MTAAAIKLHRIEKTGNYSKYQTDPVHASGIGRFQVYTTDNANARAVGRQPKWTVYDLYGNVVKDRAQLDTLAEVREWIAERLARNS